MTRALIALLLSLICLSGCGTPALRARLWQEGRNDLASVIIDTPDPAKACTRSKERLWIQWYTPRYNHSTHLNISLYLSDGTVRHHTIGVHSHFGTTSYTTDSSEPQDSVVSYKVTLVHNQQICAQAVHKLFEEPLILP